MRAYILSIGSELLLGHLTDTNATFLAQELTLTGIELLHVTQVGDDRRRLVAALRTAVAAADLVICTGGVGPTDDDLTREAIAELLGERPEVDPVLLDHITGYFAHRGMTMPARNAKQAWLIPSAKPLPNPAGTAPGWFVQAGAKTIVAMPGVPREMYRMWCEQALPRLRPMLPRRAISSTTFKTIGIGESAAEQLLDDLVRIPNPTVATYAKDDGVHVRVTAVAETVEEATALREATANDVSRRLASFIYAADDTPLAASLIRLLTHCAQTVAVAEVGTGGRFSALLASESEAGEALRGATVRPVTPGAGSTAEPDQAAQIAAEARVQFDAGLGVGLWLSASPKESGLFDGTVTVAVVADDRPPLVESFPLQAAFGELQRRGALNAADVLRRFLVTQPGAGPS